MEIIDSLPLLSFIPRGIQLQQDHSGSAKIKQKPNISKMEFKLVSTEGWNWGHVPELIKIRFVQLLPVEDRADAVGEQAHVHHILAAESFKSHE